LAFTILAFSSLSFWVLVETRRHKKKYGQAMASRALYEALHAQVSEAVLEQEQTVAAMDAKHRFDEEATPSEISELECGEMRGRINNQFQ